MIRDPQRVARMVLQVGMWPANLQAAYWEVVEQLEQRMDRISALERAYRRLEGHLYEALDPDAVRRFTPSDSLANRLEQLRAYGLGVAHRL